MERNGQSNQVSITYCTNVHPLGSFFQWKDTISYFGPKIRELTGQGNLALGLWFNSDLVREIWVENPDKCDEIGQLLRSLDLSVFTLNGFPYGDFHQKRVKKKVYQPNWTSPERAEYTLRCGEILAKLTQEDVGTLSTLPLAWKQDWKAQDMELCLKHLGQVILGFRELFDKTGRRIQLCLEPEPGCVLEHTPEVLDFWEQHWRPYASRLGITEEELQLFCGLCYDTCHQAVQFEDPVEALSSLQDMGIPVGKMQVSNALQFVPDPDRNSIEERRKFCEEKFLHQTQIQKSGGEVLQHLDLPEAIQDSSLWQYPWRSHFHLPIFADSELLSPGIETTRQDMIRAVQFARQKNLCSHYEVETYTWWVLPEEMRAESDEALAQGIAKEYLYLKNILQEEAV